MVTLQVEDMHAEIFADLICPWCYIGHQRLKKALAMRPSVSLGLTWRPFQLNPDMPAEGMDRAAYMNWKFGTSIRARRLTDALMTAAERDGVTMNLDRQKRVPNTLAGHRLVLFASRDGKATPMMERLFDAYFVDSLDIGNRDVLLDCAAAAGLNRQDAAHYLDSETDIDLVTEQDLHARRAGIDSVPCFIFDRRYAVVGAEEPEAFLPLFDAAMVQAESSPRS